MRNAFIRRIDNMFISIAGVGVFVFIICMIGINILNTNSQRVEVACTAAGGIMMQQSVKDHRYACMKPGPVINLDQIK